MCMENSGYICPECNSNNTIGHGTNVTRRGELPRRKCKSCGHTFYSEDNKVEVAKCS